MPILAHGRIIKNSVSGLHFLSHIIKGALKMKKQNISMWTARKEAWRKMLITSQKNTPPRSSKSSQTRIRNGVQIVQFRGTDEADNNKIGKSMPILMQLMSWAKH